MTDVFDPTGGRRWLPLALLLLLCGCNSDWIAARDRTAQVNAAPPVNYRAEIVALMRTYLNNPARVRDAYVSEPELRTLDNISRYMVCVRYNARNASGQYTGSKDSLVTFSQGRLENIIDSARGQCRDAAYQPFPELEAIAR